MWQGDVINPSTVAVAADAIVFGVGELECVATGRDKEGGTGPRHFARLNDEVGIVDVEVELVVAGLGRHLVVEADAVGRGEGDGDADFGRLAVGEAGGGAQTERTSVCSGVGDCPRIGALRPARGMVDTTLEGFQGIGTYINWVDCVDA